MAELEDSRRPSEKRFSLLEWAAIAEIVASVAVVISLLFVAHSIQRNTEQLRISQSNQSYEALREVGLAWATDERLSSAMRRFEREGRENLTEAQSDAVDRYGLMIVGLWEQHWVRYQDGIVPETDYRNWETFFRESTARYVSREAWQRVRWSFDAELANVVDQVFAEGSDP